MGFIGLWLNIPLLLRVRFYEALIKIGLRWYGPTTSTRCFRLPFSLYAKTGNHNLIIEADVMRYIICQTTIPIPSVVDVLSGPRGSFLIMTSMPGKQLGSGLNTMSQSQRSLLARDLKHSFDQLRSIPAPSTGPQICGFNGGPFRCFRIEYDPVGPFETEAEFYTYLLDQSHLPHQAHLKQFGHRVHSRTHPICLSHNDITPHNILVDEDGRLTAILDWECAAWLPDYWDYTRSYYARDIYTVWHQLMDTVFGAYTDELEVEKEMWKYNDPW